MIPSSDLVSLWELAKGVMITLTTGAVAWMARTLVQVRDGQRDLYHIVVGIDGQNGLRGLAKSNAERIDEIEERNTRLDAVAQAEAEQYEGEERRHRARRMRDLVREEIANEHTRENHHE